MPWAEMAKGPVSADKSLLLDYLSPFLVLSWAQALKNRHFMVVATILGFALIMLMTVASTGLLQLLPARIANVPMQLVTTNKFDGLGFGHGARADGRLLNALWGIHNYSLPQPNGTTDKYTVQTFRSVSTTGSGAVLNGTVDYFTADLECEVGDVKFPKASQPHESSESVHLQVDITTPSCLIVGDDIFPQNLLTWEGRGANANDTKTGYYGALEAYNCTNLPKGEESSNRLVVLLSNYTQSGPKLTITKVTNLVCKPVYNIGRATVLLTGSISDAKDTNVTPLPQLKIRTLAQVSAWDIG